MDEELTDGYSAPCERCAAVDWGVSDSGQFYCKSCHNVIERVQEVDDASTVFSGSLRAISQGSKRKREESKRDWLLIEGFQFVLLHQADSLLALGVCAQFKDDVLWNLWQRYLQKTKQAYTDKPICLGKVSIKASKEVDVDSAVESGSLDGSHLSGPSRDTEGELNLGASAGLSDSETLESCSVDGRGSAGRRGGRGQQHLLGMPSTLALCHLALLWAREAITLADLLRFAYEKHIPYLHVHDVFPEEMRVNGKDCGIFRVKSVPSYRYVQEEAVRLAELMELPAFPPVTLDCMLHPALLSLRYLHDANLPDALHDWVCRLMEVSGLDKDMALTFNPAKVKRVRLLSYDLQACALIIVAMKLLFRLDDDEEGVSSETCGSDNSVDMADQGLFSLWLWYETLEKALEKAKKKEQHLTASKSWQSSNTLIFNKKRRYEILRHRRLAEHLKSTFQKLSGLPPESSPPQPSSFVFRWGEGQGSHGPSFHDTRLDNLTKEESDARLTAANEKYWHPTLKLCKDTCLDHYPEVEATLPRMYVWLLGLFSFLLRVRPSCMHLEVLKVERSFMKSKKRKKNKKKEEEKETGPTKKKKTTKRKKQKKDTDKQKNSDKGRKETGRQSKPKNQDKNKRKSQSKGSGERMRERILT